MASAQILELREHVVELDGAMLQTAVQVQELHRRRTNLVAVVEKLKVSNLPGTCSMTFSMMSGAGPHSLMRCLQVVERVMNAQDALHLLLPQVWIHLLPVN